MFSIKVNGALCGYFKGAKGLRQGDPLSPYLFVLAMEVLSVILSKTTKSPGFQFHWRTQKINLSHLCFADDLMLFCHGNPSSAMVLRESLNAFSCMSGLSLNASKSFCYFANVDPVNVDSIVTIMGFQKGVFPAKFLGVPLITTRLTLGDCHPLIERILSKLSSWTNKFLSYAGRLVLVKSVLFAIQSFWASHFLLPAAVLKEIQRHLTCFLWKGSVRVRPGARVAWDKLTFPFGEGGLGIKDLRDWNKAHLILQLLKVANWANHSLWTSWVRIYLLRQKFLWTAPIPPDCSWSWRKLLMLRAYALQFLHYKIGNGNSINLWNDPWLNGRPLAHSYSLTMLRHLGHGRPDKVNCWLSSGAWVFPSSNHAEVINFRRDFDHSTHFDLAVEDSIFWGTTMIHKVEVSTIWDDIRKVSPPVCWSRLVWHRISPPRCSFLCWLLFRNGILTRDKLIQFGIPLNPACQLCYSHPESVQHLYFECHYSFQVLVALFRRCGWRGLSRRWSDITTFILTVPCSSRKLSILCCTFNMIIYYLWKERNAREHGEGSMPARVLVRHLQNLILSRLALH